MRVETFVNGKLKDLNPLFFGYDDMQPGIMCGTRIRNDVFIHYVHDGIFCVELRGKRHMVQPGEVFVILPGAEYNYYNPGRKACRVSWIALSGELSADFAVLPTVFEVDKAIFEEIDAVHEAQGRKYILLSSIVISSSSSSGARSSFNWEPKFIGFLRLYLFLGFGSTGSLRSAVCFNAKQ